MCSETSGAGSPHEAFPDYPTDIYDAELSKTTDMNIKCESEVEEGSESEVEDDNNLKEDDAATGEVG